MAGLETLRERMRRSVPGPAAILRRGRPWIWAVLLVLGLWGVLLPPLLSGPIDLEAGDVAPRDIEAPRDFVDRPTLERLRAEAAERVPPVYVHDATVSERVRESVAADFAALRRVHATARERRDLQAAEVRDLVRDAIDLPVSDPAVASLIGADPVRLAALERDLQRVLGEEMRRHIAPADLDTFRNEMEGALRDLGYPPPQTELLIALGEKHLRPNYVVDEEQTQLLRQQAMDEVEEPRIVRGEVFIRDGQRLTQSDIERLRDAGLLRLDGGIRPVAGAGVAAALLVGLGALFLWRFRPELLKNERRLVLFGLIVLATALLTTLFAPVSGYLAPVAGAAMLLAILLDPLVALLAATLLAIVVGYLSGFDLHTVVVALVGALVGIVGVGGVQQRGEIMRAGFLVALAQAGLILLLHLTVDGLPFTSPELWSQVLFGLVNGVLLAGIFTLGFLPYAESFFGILTPIRLIELANPNQPLLRRLLLKAPGTYHHSLMVANLAEAAVEAIGGNALLTRVGAYYHDIGKSRRPYFFIENQFGGENPHDRLAPSLSALVITAHVRDGIEMAKAHRLPQEIIDFIPEHHGTALVGYFYRKALSQAKEGEEVSEEQFRHDGPRPHTRETAVLMLADASEASVRSLKEPTPDRIEAMVRKIVRERLEDGQLDRSDLTLRDLDTIIDTFVQVLTGMHHSRIEYPEKAIRELEKRGPARDRQPAG